MSSDVTLGVLYALLLMTGIAFAYSGAIWFFSAAHSPFHRRRRRVAIDRIVVRETSDLDRRFAELTRSMRHRD